MKEGIIEKNIPKIPICRKGKSIMTVKEMKRYALACPTSMGVRITPENRMAVQNSNTFYMQATSAEPASDYNFNCNGIIAPDRRLNPHAYEIQYYHQNVWIKDLDAVNGAFKVYNENFFKNIDDLNLTATVYAMTSSSVKPKQSAMPAINHAQSPTSFISSDL